MSSDDYTGALKLGQRAYRAAKLKGEFPYLPALDSFIGTFDIVTESYMGLMDIPLDQIVGTKTAGRQNAFACNFMPLMKKDSEFAAKWISVYLHQSESGITDPIVVFEFMNRYYVQEGNKRVSVLKYLGAFSIEGHVTRLIPKFSDADNVHIFYEYMDFYRKTAINYICFTKTGSYASLLRSCGYDKDHIWTDEDRETFSSRYLHFTKAFDEKGGKKLTISPGDAFLLYLSIYPYDRMDEKPDHLLKSEISRIWGEFSVMEEPEDASLVLDPEDTGEANLLTRVLSGQEKRKRKTAFIYDRSMLESGWVYSHELGRMHVDKELEGYAETKAYFPDEGTDVSGLIDRAIADGNDIIFTTSELMLPDSLKAAVANPGIKILNCCLNMPYRSMRTYAGRMYEAKFLAGIVAGIMCENNKIAYTADYPIYGTMASVNAFALGVSMTNPRAKVYLHWNCIPGSELADLVREQGIEIISNVDTIRPGSGNREFGLYRLKDGRRDYLAAPIWNWGKFYEKILRDIMNGNWEGERRTRKAMNYWWGLSGGMVDIILSEKLPAGVCRLVEVIKDQIISGLLNPFEGLNCASRSGDKTQFCVLSFQEIITMHTLADNVIGRIPETEELSEDARKLTLIQGLREPEEERKLMEAAGDVRGMSARFSDGQI